MTENRASIFRLFLFILMFFFFSPTHVSGTEEPLSTIPRIIRVPEDWSLIQSAIDQAEDGDVVLVSPGLYHENIELSGKTITLASLYYTSGNSEYIDQTVIDGGGGSAVVSVMSSVGAETAIIGFTIQNGDDGVSAWADFYFTNNRVINNNDGIDYEGGGGICQSNIFENNRDDGIDLDGSTAIVIEDNIITTNGDDGIEIRLHQYSGPILNIAILNNRITFNGEDGIQLIDYPDISDRIFRIERNLIQGNSMAGFGAMSDGNTIENFEGASIPERVFFLNNTVVDNDHGVSGGDNMITLNNIVSGSTNIALKNVDGDSAVSHNLFWGNGTDIQGSNFVSSTTILADPLLDENYRLAEGSPAIDIGTDLFVWDSEVVFVLQPDAYSGVAPDLGAYEIGVPTTPLLVATRDGQDLRLDWSEVDQDIWGNPITIENYEVWRSSESYFDPMDSQCNCINIATLNERKYSDMNVFGDTSNYFYRVIAVNFGGRSDGSNIVGKFDFSLMLPLILLDSVDRNEI